MGVSADFVIDDWLREEEGILDAAGIAAARQALVDAGLTNGKKQRMTESKRERASRALWERLAGWCGEPPCESTARTTGLPVVRVHRRRCLGCGGSSIQRAARAAVEACEQAGIRRVLLLGGSPPAHSEIRQQLKQLGCRLEIGIIEPGRNVTEKDARAALARVDAVFAWAGTPLDHKVSELFARREPGAPPYLHVPTTGTASFFEALARHARLRIR